MGFHSPLIRPAIYWGGSFAGGTLDSHDNSSIATYSSRGSVGIRSHEEFLMERCNLPLSEIHSLKILITCN